MAYDSARRVTVLFGGRPAIGHNDLEDTLEWDGTNWSLVAVDGPGGRYGPSMTFDTWRGVSLLFGGGGRGDTWEWDGTAWSLRAAAGPRGRSSAAMAFDSDRGVAVLFGGMATATPPGTVTLLRDTWEWDGLSWVSRTPTGGPERRYLHAMAYDRGRGVVVLFGGFGGGANLADTWEWDGSTWSLSSTTGPSPRRLHAMSFDEVRGVTILFGGVGPDDFLYEDTWEWDGTEWTLRELSGPAARMHHAMVYDSARGMTVVVGGTSETGREGDTWVLPNCLVDGDGDGVLDHIDQCLDSDLSDTIVLGGCETGVENELLESGCTMADHTRHCTADARNCGKAVRCMARLASQWFRDGLITARERGRIQRCAGHGQCPGGRIRPGRNGR